MEKYYLHNQSDLERLFNDYVIFPNAEARKYFGSHEEKGVRPNAWDNFINPDSWDNDRHPKKYPCVLIHAVCESRESSEDKWLYLYEEDFTTILEGGVNDSKHSGG